MFSHNFVGVGDVERALAFCNPLPAALGIAPRFQRARAPLGRLAVQPLAMAFGAAVAAGLAAQLATMRRAS